MTGINDGVKKVTKHLIALFVTSNTSHRHDERVARIVHSWEQEILVKHMDILYS